jgi:hypothetical protein
MGKAKRAHHPEFRDVLWAILGVGWGFLLLWIIGAVTNLEARTFLRS